MSDIQLVNKINVFLSGNFTDTDSEYETLLRRLDEIGFNILMMHGGSKVTARQLISDSDYFLCVVGEQSGAIRLPDGRTLPQEELNEAIRQRKPVIPIIKNPSIRSRDSRQQDMRDTLVARYGRDILSYESIHGLNLIVGMLQVSGVDRYSRVLRPIRGFVSYARKDLPIVHDLVKELKTSGFPVFFDEHSIEAGASIANTIKSAIDEVGYVLICISENAFDSKWVRQELIWALETAERVKIADKPFIIPVKVGDFQWPTEFEHLSDLKYADLYANFERGMDQIKGVLM